MSGQGQYLAVCSAVPFESRNLRIYTGNGRITTGRQLSECTPHRNKEGFTWSRSLGLSYRLHLEGAITSEASGPVLKIKTNSMCSHVIFIVFFKF